MESNELIVVEKLGAIELFTGSAGVEKILDDIEQKVSAFVPDTSTAKSRKDIASLAYKVSQSKIVLDELGKSLVADWKAKSALVDASRKIVRDRLDALRDKVRRPLTNWEVEDEKRVAAEKLAAEMERAELEARHIHGLWLREKEIAAKEAELARIEEERQAKEEAELANKLMKEQIERDEAARVAHEERIKKEAAEKATREAEEAAQAAIREADRKAAEAQAAVEKAKLDRIAAEEKAKSDQAAAVAVAEEKARIAAEKVEFDRKVKESAESARIETERREAERKAADVEHRRMVNNEIISGLVAAGITEGQAKKVITAIVGGLVNHVRIQY